jgi:AcrR family transcriptional regulator
LLTEVEENLMIQASRRRRPAEGGYARGEETRLRIIHAAIGLFGRLGFEGASTREIAADAGVNTPALQYYFDSKEGLYRACAEHIVDHNATLIAPALRRAERLLEENAAPEALIDAYCEIMADFADLLFCSPESMSWAPLLVREQAGLGPEVTYSLVRERFFNPLHKTCSRLLGRITGRPADAPETQLRLMAINGQFLPFNIGRGGFLASLGWSEIGPELGGFIKAMVTDHTRAMLKAELCAAKAEGGALPKRPGRRR